MQAHRHHELAERLDGLVERDAAPLDLDAVLREEAREVGAAHRAEEPALVGGLPALGEVQGLDGLGLALRVRPELRRLRVLPRLDLLDVLEVRGGGVQGELLGQQEVARVAVGNVADLTAAPQGRQSS